MNDNTKHSYYLILNDEFSVKLFAQYRPYPQKQYRLYISTIKLQIQAQAQMI